MEGAIEMEKDAPRKELDLVLDYIGLHLNRNSLSVTEIADAAAISLQTLERMFLEWKGCTIIHYVQLSRLDMAAQILQETFEPVNYIAQLCGFDDPAYFSRAFRKNFNLSPSDFRKEHTTLTKKSKILRKKSNHR